MSQRTSGEEYGSTLPIRATPATLDDDAAAGGDETTIALDIAPPPIPGPAERVAELREIADLYLSGRLSHEMLGAAEDLLVAALDDPAVSVREAMAEAFAAEGAAPRALVIGLANDIPRIAALVVERTPCLLDVELIEIARTAGPRVLTALASRPAGSVTLVERLVDRADAALALRLAENRRLPLGGAALERLIARFGARADVRDALLRRPGLPAMARLTLVEQFSARLVAGMGALHWVAQDRLDAASADARSRAALEACDGPGAVPSAIVHRLQAAGQLTPKLVLRAACEGRIGFLVAALVRLSGASETRVVALLSAYRKGPLEALCRRSGLPDGFSDALRAAAAVMSEGPAEDLARRPYLVSERVLARYELGRRRQPAVHAALRGLAAEASRDEARRRKARAA